MALFDDENRALLIGLGIGGVSATIAPFVVRAAAPAVRPLLKALLVQAMLAAELGVEAFARLGEGLEDLLAEARADVERELGERGIAPRRAARAEREEAPGAEPRGHA